MNDKLMHISNDDLQNNPFCQKDWFETVSLNQPIKIEKVPEILIFSLLPS